MATTIYLDAEPTPPSGGSGNTEVQHGSHKIELTWKDGKIVGVKGGPTHEELEEQKKPESASSGGGAVVTCEKCAKDSTSGNKICWDVPC